MERDQPRPASTTRPLMKTNWRHQDKDVFQVKLGTCVLVRLGTHVLDMCPQCNQDKDVYSSRARGRTTGYRAAYRGPSCSITRTKAKVGSKAQAKASTRPRTARAEARCRAPTLATSRHRARARHQRCCQWVR